MAQSDDSTRRIEKIRFGEFELSLRPLCLCRQGRPVNVQLKPLKLIALLASEQGKLVTHEDIRECLWRGRTVEFTRSIHVCVSQARSALGDNAGAPEFIENVPGQGYRFVSKVEQVRATAGRGLLLRQWPLSSRQAAMICIIGVATVCAAYFYRNGPTSADTVKTQHTNLLYNKGIELLGRHDRQSAAKSISYFDAALKQDPRYARAHIGASKALWRLRKYTDADRRARQALAIDGALADAHTIVGMIDLMNDWDWESAFRSFSKALAQDVMNVEAHRGMALLYALKSDFVPAKRHIEKANELKPGSIIIRTQLAWIYYYAREFDKAARLCSENLSEQPSETTHRYCLIKALSYGGRHALAKVHIVLFMQQLNASEREIERVLNSRPPDLLAAFERWRLERPRAAWNDVEQSSSQLAIAAAGAREFDKAVFYAGLALNERCSMIPFIAIDPAFAPVARDARFLTLLRQLKLR